MNNVLMLNNNLEIVNTQDRINHKTEILIFNLINLKILIKCRILDKILNKMKLIIIKFHNNQVIYLHKNLKEVQKVQKKLKDFKNQLLKSLIQINKQKKNNHNKN